MEELKVEGRLETIRLWWRKVEDGRLTVNWIVNRKETSGGKFRRFSYITWRHPSAASGPRKTDRDALQRPYNPTSLWMKFWTERKQLTNRHPITKKYRLANCLKAEMDSNRCLSGAFQRSINNTCPFNINSMFVHDIYYIWSMVGQWMLSYLDFLECPEQDD
jgi:hypothetical protein